jgi:predicted DNA binding CopG/RHH family protein
MNKQRDQEQDFQNDEAFEDSLEGIDWKKIRKEGAIVHPKSLRGRKKIGEKISLTLGSELIERLKNVSGKRGIGYQTMIRLILNEKVKDYENMGDEKKRIS